MADEPTTSVKSTIFSVAFFTGMLATVLTIGFFGYLGALFVVAIPEKNRDLINTAGGILFGGAGMAWGFYLSSNSSSKGKDQTIATLTEDRKPPAPSVPPAERRP